MILPDLTTPHTQARLHVRTHVHTHIHTHAVRTTVAAVDAGNNVRRVVRPTSLVLYADFDAKVTLWTPEPEPDRLQNV